MKTCSKCKESKPLDQFYKDLAYSDGFRSQCKACKKQYHKQWRSNNKTSIAVEKKNWYLNNKEHKSLIDRNNHYKRKYGITLEQYNQMFTNQNGNCAICGRNQSEFKVKLCVDHCHATGRVRGLLCDNCNTSLGGFQDNPDLLRKAAKYVE